MIQFIIAIISSFFLGFLVRKYYFNDYRTLRLVTNKDKQVTENAEYYIGKADINNRISNVSFTIKEVEKAVKRAEKNQEDF
jgi:hypothetical protein